MAAKIPLPSSPLEQWGDVWDSFDKRQKAKAGPAANDAPEEEGDMFSRAGVAAE